MKKILSILVTMIFATTSIGVSACAIGEKPLPPSPQIFKKFLVEVTLMGQLKVWPLLLMVQSMLEL